MIVATTAKFFKCMFRYLTEKGADHGRLVRRRTHGLLFITWGLTWRTNVGSYAVWHVAQAFWDDHWGDLASVAGLIVSLVGFFWTILAALGAKNAAKQAREAARQARDRVLHIDGFSQFTEALTVMEEVKRLHRAQAWATALERYGTLRRLLISVRSASAGWPAEHKAALTGAIQQFTEMEKLVEEATQRGNKFPKFARLNGIITHERDKLAEVLDQSKHLLVEK